MWLLIVMLPKMTIDAVEIADIGEESGSLTQTLTVKYLVKCHDSPLYSCASLELNISVTGDEDRFVKMWFDRLGDTSVKWHLKGLMSSTPPFWK